MRELAVVAALVILADLTIYRGYGFAGLGTMCAAAPILLRWGAPGICRRFDSWITGVMLLILAAALLWCGTPWQVAIGAVLVFAFAMSVAGLRPYMADLLLFAIVTSVTGCSALARYSRSLNRVALVVPRATWLKVVLPAAAVAGFGTLFIFANPDEATTVGRWLTSAWTAIQDHLGSFVPSLGESLFWIGAAWIAGGLLRPLIKTSIFAASEETLGDRLEAGRTAGPTPDAEISLFPALRNTLIAVIVLFAAYLVFEFQTLWFRVFPKGFYYSGYAHEGAAWLTAVLALATAVLSAIFRTSVLNDPRVPRLRRLAWIWSFENLLLALAVYHRLSIYIGFNGMTRMRTVGFLGITAVVIGFCLVIWKMTHGRGFVWLINRQLWTLAVAIYLYAVLPVDVLVHRYNVGRILAGDLAPSVQISVHPIDSGGVLTLRPLLNCENESIREGVRALLAERGLRAEEIERQRALENWTSFQLADRLLFNQLQQLKPDWTAYADPTPRRAAWEQFRAFAYQWY